MKKILASLSGLVAAAVISAAPLVSAATTVVVYPGNEHGWTSTAPPADTRPGGTASLVADSDTPMGTGALSLTTDSTTAAKAQYMTANHAGTKLSDVTEISYWTKQVSASFVAGDPSFQLQIDTDGTAGDGLGFATLVYEPYIDQGNAAVQNNIWQKWDVDAGQFWSTRTVAPLLVNGFGGCTVGLNCYSLSQVISAYPNAIVLGIGVNVGTFNTSYDTRVDGVTFNDTTYDFESTAPLTSPTNKDECKKDNWKTFNNPVFKNQGQCVSFVERNQNANTNAANTRF